MNRGRRGSLPLVVFLELSDERFDPGGVLVRLEVRGEAPLMNQMTRHE